MLKTEIVKNIVLTSCMVTVGLSTVIVGGKIETLRENSTRQMAISSINATSSATPSNKKKTASYARVQSRPSTSNNSSMPMVASPSTSARPVSTTATPSVVVAAAPMGSGYSVSDMSRKSSSLGGGSNGGSGSLSSSTRMLAAASRGTASHTVSISEPFADVRPSNSVRTRGTGLPGEDPGEPMPDPEPTPLGDGIWFLLCCVAAYVGFTRLRAKRA